MSFESLSEVHVIEFENFPVEWFPLTYLYDPDLPLFPLIYIHALDPLLPTGVRPGEHDRIYGFVQHIGLQNGKLQASLIVNKDLTALKNAQYVPVVKELVANRFGLGSPITAKNVQNAFSGTLNAANEVLLELWHLIVDAAFGGMLPFGKILDEVQGLIRFIASWNSDGGRKGELIQTHYFLAAFGERIATSSGVSASFYLLPTFSELTDATNPLSIFPRFRDLIEASSNFVGAYCSTRDVGDMKFSSFDMKTAGLSGSMNTEKILSLIGRKVGAEREALYENYSAFNRGPVRSVIALMMLHDVRSGHWDPAKFSPEACADMYRSLGGSYQSPKVIQLYAQQCFGCECALPIDIWIDTFVRWPLGLKKTRNFYHDLFAASASWGRIERLVWVAAQSRKVHASVASEILWCIRYGGEAKLMRGANPLSCNICDWRIRKVCPAYRVIASSSVSFNVDGADFRVDTSAKNSEAAGQTFISCRSDGCADTYSPRDRPSSFLPFPQIGYSDGAITVEKFIDNYRR